MTTKAVKKRPKRTVKKISDPEEALARYEEVFQEIARFVAVIESSVEELTEAEAEVAEAKAAYEAARDEVNRIKELRDGAKHGLFRYLAPRNGGEILPLFDRMEKADEERHGENSTEWRKEPIAALKLSLPSLVALNEADIMFVGQLQDSVLNDPEEWWHAIPGLTFGQSAAIVDRLNEFIADRTSKA